MSNGDFREQLVSAIAYRMLEMWRTTKDDRPSPVQARDMVRDAMKQGTASEHWGPVSKAATDMAQPLVGAFLPIISQITSALVIIVQAQNQRGEAIEQNFELSVVEGEQIVAEGEQIGVIGDDGSYSRDKVQRNND